MTTTTMNSTVPESSQAGALSALGIALGILIFLRREKYRAIPPSNAQRRAV